MDCHQPQPASAASGGIATSAAFLRSAGKNTATPANKPITSQIASHCVSTMAAHTQPSRNSVAPVLRPSVPRSAMDTYKRKASANSAVSSMRDDPLTARFHAG